MKISPVKKKKQLIAQNEATLLQLVRSHPGISRVELAPLMGIAPSTIGIFVSRLIDEGFLLEHETIKLKKGRPRTSLTLNPDGGCLLGVDIEANRIRAVRLNFAEEVQDSVSIEIDPDHGVDAVLESARDAVQRVLCENRSRILGLGVASPGPVNIETGISLYYKYIKGWENVPVGSFFKKGFNVPIYLESNLRAIASAELWFGQGRAVDQFVSIAVRSGIGAGIVMRGEVCRGAHSGAGEIGAWRVPASFLNKPLIKSVFGSGRSHIELEEIASVRSVLKNISTCIADGQTSSLPVDQAITVIDVLEAYHQGDKLTVAHLHAAADALGWAIGQIDVMLDPGKIILSGRFAELGDPFIGRIRRAASEQVQEQHLACTPEIVASELGEFSGALGAAAQIVQYWTPPR
jgi:N-acetylglucosamine repressor